MALTRDDSPAPVAPMLFGAAGGGSTGDQTPYNAPTYFPPAYFYGGGGDSSVSPVPTTPSGGLTPYNAPTYFPPAYFYGGGGGSLVSPVPTTPTGGLTPYNAPTYFPPAYFYGGGGGSLVSPVPTTPTPTPTPTPSGGLTPYNAPTYFPPAYFYGGASSVATVPTTPTPTLGMTPYNAPTYFPPAYFYGGPATPTAIVAGPKAIPGRDGACYAALIAAIEAIGSFDSVVFGDPTRRAGAGADSHPLAIVTPRGWEEADETDPTLYVRRVSFTVRVVIRVEEGAEPFDQLDRLAAAVQVRLDQSDLDGTCLAPLTKIRAGRYQPSSRYPEWSVDLDGEFSVLIDPAADLAAS